MTNDQVPEGEISGPDSTSSDEVANISRWWSRKGLDSPEILEQAVGLAYGNDNCKSFYEALIVQPTMTDTVKKVFGTAANLGRDLAMHPHLRWLASTTAGLYDFHSKREDFIHATIVAFVVQANQTPGTLLSERNAKYDPAGIAMKRAVKTVIDAVWWHVVQEGGARLGTVDFLPLPLDGICACEEGHYLKPFELGSCLAQVRAVPQQGGEIVVESMYLIKDMVWWLWYHFPGNLTIVVGGEILKSKPGDHADGSESAPSSIEIRIQKSCPLKSSHVYTSHRSRSMENTIKFHVVLAGKAHNLFERMTDITGNALLGDRGPAARICLYDIPNVHRDGDATADSRKLQAHVRSTAVDIVSWLLYLPVSGTVEDSPDLAFTVWSDPGDKEGSDQPQRMPRVMDLVTRSPFMLNLGWGHWGGDATAVFEAPSAKKTKASSKGKGVDGEPVQNDKRSTTATEIGVVLDHYPVLSNLVNSDELACKCMSCRRQKDGSTRPPGNALFDQGCLRNKALMAVLHLIAHAIADCFGCHDISAPSSDAGDLGVLALLSAVARGVVRWNDWFAVASRVFLGCPDLLEAQGPGGTDKNPRLAVQYGSLATLAPWLDLSADLRLIKPFSMESVKGRIHNVEGDFALIVSRPNETTEAQVDGVEDNRKKRKGAVPECTALVDSDTTLQTDMILVPVAQSHYELWLRVRTKKYSRLIDPSSAVRALPRLLGNQHLCSHTVDSAIGYPIAGAVQARSFDNVLGTWGIGSSTSQGVLSEKDIFCGLSPLCDSHLRLNVTASLTLHHARILTSEEAYVACRLKEKKTLANMMSDPRQTGLKTNAGFAVSVSTRVLEGRHATGAPMIEWGECYPVHRF